MSLQATLDRIPAHLRRFVVQQDYSAYDEIDQAVWRFTLLQTHHQLKHTAHQSYVKGLNRTGIYLDRIPRIEEMNDCLSEFGWGAVCVHGFIPPRAFQEFQALGILTINADIRRAGNLAYTPSPDIIHEAAGHAPIIPDPIYARFLKRFGEVGKQAFASKEDLAVYTAIKDLSSIKEDLNSTPAQIEQAMEDLYKALDSVPVTTEAAFLGRLHWWTVEYGLIGKPEDYKIYGAGILSSVGESTMLHLPEVKKMRLRARCVETDYDITEQQPQLYVVESFERLDEILDQVVADFAFKVGGKLALQRAVASGEVGTVHFNSGLQVIGELTEIVGGKPGYLRFTGPCALACDGKILDGHDRTYHADGFGMPVDRLADGIALSSLSTYDLGRFGYRGPGSRISLDYRSGIHLEGNLDNIVTNSRGDLLLLTFNNCRVTMGDRLLFDPAWGSYDLGVGESVPSAHAGAVDLDYWPATEFSEATYPKHKRYSSSEQQLLDLYRNNLAAWDEGVETALSVFAETTEVLERDFPDHWLQHWNMLEKLVEVDRGVKLSARLKTTMKEIESRDFSRIPVTLGLRYLGLH
ncbi:MAG: aromatic amino acid hydroxylase [Acidobacteriota bacterium]|nr:aromatic amino acid hydroxylase [Acidobacteriota bacterium]